MRSVEVIALGGLCSVPDATKDPPNVCCARACNFRISKTRVFHLYQFNMGICLEKISLPFRKKSKFQRWRILPSTVRNLSLNPVIVGFTSQEMSYYCFQSIPMRYGALFSRSINNNTFIIREMLIHRTDFHRTEVQRADNGIQVISKEKHAKLLEYSHNCTYYSNSCLLHRNVQKYFSMIVLG